MLPEGNSIGYTVITGWWKVTDTVNEFLDCNRMVLDKTIVEERRTQNRNISGRVSVNAN